MIVGLAMASLAVDLARVQVAKTEILTAADAAALAAAQLLPTRSTATTAAVNTAAAITADGRAVALDSNLDVEFGTWDSTNRVFTATSASSTANAVRVTVKRVASRSNAIPLSIGSIFGINSCDVCTSAVATSANYGYGMIGLTSIKMSGNATASYRSDSSSFSATQHGSIASNGNITLSGSTYVDGDARPGMSGTVSGASGRVSGITTSVPAPLSFPNLPTGDPGTYATVNNNSELGTLPGATPGDLNLGSNTSLTLSGGTYYLHNLNLSGTATLTLNGPTTIYVSHDLTLSGTVNVNLNLPRNLKIIMTTNGNVTVSGSSALYSSIYAPQSPIKFTGTGDIYGSVLGKTIDMSGSSAVYYDLALTANSSAVLVK